MRLAIADPPYLPGPAGDRRASRHYAQGSQAPSRNRFAVGRASRAQGDHHNDAHLWDSPLTHQQLVEHLRANYDGWAVAMMPNNLRTYLPWVPPDTRVCVWTKPNPVPTGSRIATAWEPVLVFVPPTRRGRAGPPCGDVMAAAPGGNFVGAKPAAWTRWVLDMLGYDPDTDTVDDLFPGSGAVAAEVAQQVLL